MYRDQIFSLSYEALYLILVLSAPPILISMLAGLIVAVFQAATQIQEQTLSFAVKLVTAILTIIVMGGWISIQITQYALNIFQNFPLWRE
jgi:type III secretion protein S